MEEEEEESNHTTRFHGIVGGGTILLVHLLDKMELPCTLPRTGFDLFPALGQRELCVHVYTCSILKACEFYTCIYTWTCICLSFSQYTLS